MNKRILELARQSGATDQDGNRATYCFCFTGQELEDFVEKIVRECASVANENVGAFTPGCGVAVAEHFGVDI